MDTSANVERAVELLQQLGLKEYEAKSVVAFSRLPQATAKTISENSEVPRTRVYDAVRVLEAKGLVQKQHSNPQRFQAVSVEEAAKTLRVEYESRTETLKETLNSLEAVSTEDDSEFTHEVWAQSGAQAIANRAEQLIGEATREVVFVVGDETVLTETHVSQLTDAQQRGVPVIVGTITESARSHIQSKLPEANVFMSGLEWLGQSPETAGDDTEISRLLLVDQNTILTSTNHVSGGAVKYEQAVFGRGFNNGLVTTARRLMATGLLPADDPGVIETE